MNIFEGIRPSMHKMLLFYVQYVTKEKNVLGVENALFFS
jgi:hypothetical protein